MKNRKILYGVCGIGGGHTYRQLPIVEKLAQHNTIVIFAYGVSLRYYSNHFAHQSQVTVVEVAVPYYPGNDQGLDFLAAADLAAKSDVSHVSLNSRAMAVAERIIGKPDLVISDYEPVSAQYAYAYDAPLVTIDQQSKYLTGAFPTELSGLCDADEVMRLRMFFPRAALRIACSFFRPLKATEGIPVTIVPSVLRPRIESVRARRRPDAHTILVYLSAQYDGSQKLEQICAILSRFTAYTFHLFVPDPAAAKLQRIKGNIRVYPHGAADFEQLLESCTGMISTAGHGLLSEAMYLGIPVLALPLALYEQAMNAEIVGRNGFGSNERKITPAVLDAFLKNLPTLAHNIKSDRKVLLRKSGTEIILGLLEEVVNGKGQVDG